MTRLVLLLAVAAAAGTAAGCGPTQAQSPTSPLPPMQVNATPVAGSHDAGAMKALPPRP